MQDPTEGYKRKLVEKYTSGTASEKELQAFFGLLGSNELNEYIDEEMNRTVQAIREEEKEMRRKKTPLVRWVAMSCVLLTLLFGGYFYFLESSKQIHYDTTIAETDIAPGRNRATLILEDGSKVTLSEDQKRIIVNAKAIKYPDGTKVPGIDASERISFSTISTPKGGQYQIVLSDGTKVWLNASSSLRYPNAFPDGERVVELTGEGYFEVAEASFISDQGQQKKRVPFKVLTQDQVVEVLGTHFNINGYKDEGAIKTTLLEGRVRVKSIPYNSSKELLPGQQSVLEQSDWKITKANVEEAIAWKNEIFYFNNTPIDKLMRQISRWYNIEVEYTGEIPSEFFTGEMSRNVSLHVLLKFLKDSGVDYQINGRVLTIRG